MERILITGANRGIGLELVQQYARRADVRIFATTRTPGKSRDLNGVAASAGDKVTVVPLDVTNPAAIKTAAQIVARQVDGLDILMNNAAINPPRDQQTLDTIKQDVMLATLHVNSVGPLLIAQAFRDLLAAGENPRMINISSGLGSLAGRQSGGTYAYCASKAALNMVTRGLAADLGPQGVTTIALNPGWVKTDMGGPNAALLPSESVAAIIALVDRLTPADNGTFRERTGETHAW